MSSAKIKSIEEVVANLRTKDELDEKKWMKIQSEIKKRILLQWFFYGLFLLIMLIDFTILTIIACSFVIYGTYIFFQWLDNIITRNIYIANYGVETEGFVDSFQQKFLAPSFINVIGYHFFDRDKHKYRGEWDIKRSRFNIANGIVKVRYIPDDPSLNIMFLVGDESNYNLKVKD